MDLERLPAKLSKASMDRGLAVLDALLEEKAQKTEAVLADLDFLSQAKNATERAIHAGCSFAKASVLVPVGLWGFNEGFTAPDLDIRLLGIGNHRFFLFHSAIGLVILRQLYRRWLTTNERPDAWTSRVQKKVAGALLGSYAVGVGIHLAIDALQPKAVIFPFFGSLIDGTLVDDNIWLLANSAWAFRISHDIFVIALGDELETAKTYVRERFFALREIQSSNLKA